MRDMIKKILALIITLFIVSIFTFTAFLIIPGDSASSALGMDADQKALEQYREEFGLDKNLPTQYAVWLKNTLKGNFGMSAQYKVPVSELIRDRFPVTVWLALLSFLIILVLAIPLGIIAARYKGRWIDNGISFITQIGMSIPSFFLGMLISLFFGIILKWFTPGKYINYNDNFTGFIRFLIFPAFAIALPKVAMLVKLLRSSILRQWNTDYVRTAKSKGMKAKAILYHHVLKNAFIPVITFLGMILADILAGTILIEQVFNLPGLGRTLLSAISFRDYSVVQIIILYIAAVVIIINFFVDMIYRRLDPRVRG